MKIQFCCSIALMYALFLSAGCRDEKATGGSSSPPDAPAQKVQELQPPDQPDRQIAALLDETKSMGYFRADPDDRVALVKKIGSTRSPVAIPFLVENLMKISPVHTSNAVDYGQTFPCSTALVEIGEAAVPQIEARLIETTAGGEQMVLIDTLCRIKGSGYVVAWLDSLPDNGIGSLPDQRRSELRQWVSSIKP